MPRLPKHIPFRRNKTASPPSPDPSAATAIEPGRPADEPSAEAATPAGAPTTVTSAGGMRERSQMRRRLRYLRQARELGFRDLGGLIFDLRRFRRQRFDLVEAKLQSLAAIDQELRTLEGALDDRRAVVELREAGITACPRCNTLLASDANFCSFCGLQVGNAPAISTSFS